jgi:DNA ligase-1
MLAGDLPAVAVAAHAGAARLAEFRLEHFRPVQPMLASPVDDLEEIWGRREGSGSIQLEHKLDGARVQVHRRGNEVRVYTRQLHEVTSAVPEIVEEIRALDAQSVVLDGETFACDVQGRSLPFQVTMRRFGRRSDTEQMRQRQPLRTLYFDCLERDGFELLGRPLHERWSHLGELFDPTSLVPRLAVLPNELARAREFLTQALEQGREGLMAKEVESTYEAGRRGASWLKIKPVHTLDLVVLAAEWGSGRRRGWLSNLHLGARDPTSGAFVMLGKTFKGLTDQTLRWQTKRLQELRLEPPPQAEQHEWVVQVRPELVVEIACNNIQASPQYPAGMALRFARVKRYRPDKTAEEANTVHDVRAIFQSEQGPVADPAEQSSAKEPDLPPEKSTLS